MANEKQTLKVLGTEIKEESVKLVLLNQEETEAFNLVLFKKDYDKEAEKWNETEETTERYLTDLNEFFGLMTDEEQDFESLVGKEFEFFTDNEGKAYIHERKGLTKPTLEQEGDLESGKIVDVIDYETKRVIVVDVDGTRYGVNFNFAEYVKPLDKYVTNKGKKAKQMDKYKNLTGKDWEDTDLKDKAVMIEIKTFSTANGKVPFIEMKKIKK